MVRFRDIQLTGAPPLLSFMFGLEGTLMAERVELDLTAVQTPGELQQFLFELFRLPGWYGFNWNAFQDSITDPEQSTLPAALIVRGWGALAVRLPEDARYLRESLEEASATRRECRLEWAEPAAAPDRRGV